MIRHVAFTVYPVSDMDRARRFYETTLGLTVSEDFDNHWVEYAPGGAGVFAISDMPEVGRADAQAGGTIAFEVDDVDAMTATVRAAGGLVVVEPFDTPVCRLSVVLDPEGNSLILHRVTA
jgi:predicted enzyme related to lactoylglutathione lyase